MRYEIAGGGAVRYCSQAKIWHFFCGKNGGFQLTFLHPPVRATVGEVRYSIEIDVGGGSKGSILQNQILRKILAKNGLHV